MLPTGNWQLATLFDNCRETFTDVMSPLQIRLFMQNKANFRKSQMNVINVLTKDYDKMDTWWSGKNKANSNPIKANSNPIKANIKPKQSQYKPKQTQSPRPQTLPIWLGGGKLRFRLGEILCEK